MDISIVVPLYNEAESLPELAAWIERVMAVNGFSYEVIFVNDVKGQTAFLGFVIVSQMFAPVVLLIGIYQVMQALHLTESPSAATTASRPPSTPASPAPRATWSSPWTPTFRTRPTRFPSSTA